MAAIAWVDKKPNLLQIHESAVLAKSLALEIKGNFQDKLGLCPTVAGTYGASNETRLGPGDGKTFI